MPSLIDIRPEAVNLDFYPGNLIVLTVNFPAGYLSTRVIKSYLGGRASPGVEGTCVEATDVLTITFTGAQTTSATTAIDGPMVWEMDLFTAGTPDVYEVLLTGIWTPGTDGSPTPSAATLDLTIAPTIEITVTI